MLSLLLSNKSMSSAPAPSKARAGSCLDGRALAAILDSEFHLFSEGAEMLEVDPWLVRDLSGSGGTAGFQ